MTNVNKGINKEGNHPFADELDGINIEEQESEELDTNTEDVSRLTDHMVISGVKNNPEIVNQELTEDELKQTFVTERVEVKREVEPVNDFDIFTVEAEQQRLKEQAETSKEIVEKPRESRKKKNG